MSEDFEEERLDSPLVVHKATDASYHEAAGIVDVEITHIDAESSETLERHRFRKEKKKRKSPYIIIALVVIAAVFAGLYYGGVLPNIGNSTTEPEKVSNESTEPVNKYEGMITVKGTYVFFEGEEVDGIQGLTRAIRYLDEGAAFVVQNESADDAFLNDEILPLLDAYNIEYDVVYTISSGLISSYENVTEQASAAPSSDDAQQ